MNVATSFMAREQGFQKTFNYKDYIYSNVRCTFDCSFDEEDFNNDLSYEYLKPSILVCKFSASEKYKDVLCMANEIGEIAVVDTSNEITRTRLEKHEAHSHFIFDISWKPYELKLLTASGDRSVCLWDLNCFKKIQAYISHTHSVKTVTFRYEDTAVFATGGRDGVIKIWDTRSAHSEEPDNQIYNAHDLKSITGVSALRCRNMTQMPKHTNARSITGLVFQNDYTLFSCSAGDGYIKAWDIRKNYTNYRRKPRPKHYLHYGGTSNIYNGFSSLIVNSTGNTLYASCVDNHIYAYNVSTLERKEPDSVYYGHGAGGRPLSFFVKASLSVDGEYLASGATDDKGYIWNTKRPGKPFIELNGHTDEVTCMAFSPIEGRVVTCSDDARYKIWESRKHRKDDKLLRTSHCVRLYESPAKRLPRSLLSDELNISFYKNNTNDNNISSMQDYPKSPFAKITRDSVSTIVLETMKYSQLSSRWPKQPALNVYRNLPKNWSTQENTKSTHQDSPASSKITATTLEFTPSLPNFIIDGTAPHLSVSPQKKNPIVECWLTKLRKRRQEQIRAVKTNLKKSTRRCTHRF